MKELNNHNERAHALLSASSAHRWLECPPSAIAAEAYPSQDTEYTREGTLAHEVAEAIARGEIFSPGMEGDIEEHIPQEMFDCAEAYRDYIQEQIKTDDAVVLLEQRVDYSPWAPDGFGTADCIILQGDTMDVIDYKYGKGVAVSATDNPQEKLYGLGALNDYGFAYDIKKVRLHIFQPRMNNTDVYELTVDELLGWGARVKHIAVQAAKGEGEYCAGSHCKFCPHAGRCRTLTKTCIEYVNTHGIEVGIETLAPWEIAEVLEMEPIVTLWLKRVKMQALTSMMNGAEVPGFKVVEGKLGNRKWTDELKAAAALEAAGYSREDITETKLLSPSAMDKAIGKKKAAEILSAYIDRAPGAPVIAPASDKRPAYDRLSEAQNDFN